MAGMSATGGEASLGVETGIEETAAAVGLDHGNALDHLTGLAVVVVIALLCGILLSRWKQPPAVGYILAGLVMGPSALALVENREMIQFMAELGVILLLFIVGMELSLESFAKLWRIAFGTFGLQLALGMGAGFLTGWALDWGVGESLVLGFVLSLSSTAVAIKMLEDLGDMATRTGQIAVGVLIAQDLAVVPMMLVIAGLGSGGGLGWEIAIKIVVAVVVMAALIYVLIKRAPVKLPFEEIVLANTDLRALAGIAFCFAAAAISGLLGFSTAYGAFLAGLIIGNSRDSHAMQETVAPIQSMLVMVFFLSIGLLLDLGYLWDNIILVLLLVLLVLLVKTAANIAFLRALGETWENAVIPGALLGQIGEFAFVLGAMAVALTLVDDDTYRLIVSVTVLSLVFSPAWMVLARRVHRVTLVGVSSGRELLRLVFLNEVKELRRMSRRAEDVYDRVVHRHGRATTTAQDLEEAREAEKKDGGERTKDEGLPPLPM